MTRVAWMLIALGWASAVPAQTPAEQSAASISEAASGRSAAQSERSWSDPSPHQVHFVEVDSPSVRLEVLDWGGVGRPILFVGCYLSAHVYDDIAPKLTDRFHVYAVTRRGVGASDRQPLSYEPQRRADDIFEVIDSLSLQKPMLIGHSCGGGILHTLGAQHPDRVGGLVYLDAAEDPTLRLSDYDAPPVDPAHFPAFVGTPPHDIFPEAERRQLAARPMDPVIRKAIVEDNNVRPDYAGIRAPVLAIYRTTTLEQALKDFPPGNDQQRAAFNRGWGDACKVAARLTRRRSSRLDCRAPRRELVYVLSNEADIIREVRAFAATLQ